MKGFRELCMVVPFWIILTAVEAIVTPELFTVFYVLKALFLNVIPYVTIWFLLHFIESKLTGYRAVRYFFIIAAALSNISLLTNPLHMQHIVSYEEPPVTGPLLWVNLAISMSCMLIVYVMLFRYIVKNYRKYPMLTLTGIGAVVPMVLYLMYLFIPSIIRHDVTPVGYTFTIILFAYTAYAPRLRRNNPGLLGNTLGVIAKSPDISSGDIKAAAGLISREGCVALGAYRVRIWDYDAQLQMLSCIACYDNAAGQYTDQDDLDMRGIEGFNEYLVSRRIMEINDAAEASSSFGLSSSNDTDVCSVLMAPVCIANVPVGLVCVEQNRCAAYPGKREWNEEEQSFTASLADIMAIANVNTKRLDLMHMLEEELSESRNLTRAVTEASPIAYLMTDGTLKPVDCNETALKIFGCPDKQYFLDHYWDKFSPEVQPDGETSREKAKTVNAKVLDGETCIYEWMHITYDGEPLPMENVLTKVTYDNKSYVVSYKHDLRRIKEVEQELREGAERERSLEIQREAAQIANEAKTRLLANMSHEIRTPMHVITGMSDLLLSEELNERQRQYAVDIKTSADALLNIINDILDISKLQAAKLTLLPVHYHFKTFINNVISIGKYLISDKGSTRRCEELLCHYEIDEDIPEYIYGDDVRLRQIFINLLSNAIKYSDEGCVSMTIEMQGDNMFVTISDTGRGIPEEDIPNLFNAFERLDEANTRHEQGTGLGLAITKSLLELMGGKIWCKSVYGEGTSFYFTVPIIPGDAALAKSSEEHDNIYAPEADVLIVDDRELNLKVIHDLLLKCDIEADCATSGTEAIRMATAGQKTYDLIFMDHMMPVMDGVETTAALREAGCRTPVVALTANAVSGAREALISAGMNDFISKPVSKPELYRVLKEWLPAEKINREHTNGEKAEMSVTDGEEGDNMYTTNTVNDATFWDAAAKIKGLSVAIGLSTASGNRNDYKNTLQILSREVGRSVSALPAFLEKRDMKGFCTEAHGIKGALHLAGAMSLSAKARELENASRNGDFDYCRKNLAEFTSELARLGTDLKAVFEQSGTERSKASVAISHELRTILTGLIKAMDSMDLDVIFADIDKLLAMKLTGELGSEVKNLTEALQIMNYDSAKVIIRNLIGG